MKNYPFGFALVVPHIDHDGGWNRTLLTTNDPIDRRRIKRGLRIWVKQNLGRHIGPVELRLLLKNVQKHKQPMMYLNRRIAVNEPETSDGS